ncbi:hypothetical protein C0989_003851 [Termitomyces sp. Mn162]|nr:hypothetical protein C0989_003851 [Termitomyces sp. Mn162]
MTAASEARHLTLHSQVKKKYKPIAMKTKLVTSHISKDFQIEQHIIGDPLAKMPPLDPNPLPFIPTQQFTSNY